jgi:hypothetical protein
MTAPARSTAAFRVAALLALLADPAAAQESTNTTTQVGRVSVNRTYQWGDSNDNTTYQAGRLNINRTIQCCGNARGEPPPFSHARQDRRGLGKGLSALPAPGRPPVATASRQAQNPLRRVRPPDRTPGA